MAVLELQGEEPQWHKHESVDPNDLKSLSWQKQSLIKQKANLASELTRTQNLLQL